MKHVNSINVLKSVIWVTMVTWSTQNELIGSTEVSGVLRSRMEQIVNQVIIVYLQREKPADLP